MRVSESETRWAKIGKVTILQYVGKDVIFYGSGCHLNFINLTTKEELLYTANTARIGDGIKCYGGHRTQHIFAFAEKCPNPDIFVKSYPSFEDIHLLKNGERRGYLTLTFTENLLITIGDLPYFNVTVWNWRQGERIASHEGGILVENQLLRSSLGSPVFLAQLGINSKFLHVWDIYMCGKKCILTQHIVKVDIPCQNFTFVMWTSEGGLYVMDAAGCIYMVTADHCLEKIINFSTPGNFPTNCVWYKSSMVVIGPNYEIRQYKKSGTWSLEWSMVPPEPMGRLMTRIEHLIGVTVDYNIMEIFIAQSDFKYIKQQENRFDDFCLIYPMGQYIMVLSMKQFINLYKVSTGELMSVLSLDSKALVMVENPKFPYAAIGYDNGEVDLISVFDPENMTKMCTFNLINEPIDGICFNKCGTVFGVASLTIGRFFIIEGIPGGQMEILATIDAKRQIADYILAVSLDCYRIFMVPVTSTKYIGGNMVIRYCIIKDKKTDIKEYTFDDKNVCFGRIVASPGTNRDRLFYMIPVEGKMIHEVEVRKGESTAKVVQKIVTGHQMRDIHLRMDKKSAVTWGYDGFVIARSSDFMSDIGIALPHHRMDAGVKKAYVGPYEKYIISLGRDGVLVCTNLKKREIEFSLKNELEDRHYSPDYQMLFSKKTIGFTPRGMFEGKCFLEVQEMKRIEKERLFCRNEREAILVEFKTIRKELQDLLTANLEGPENERLDLKEFNLNVKSYEEKAARHKKLRKATEIFLKSVIDAQNKISEFMIVNFWKKMRVPGTSIKALFANFEVTNYVLRPPDPNREDVLEWIRHQRRIERHLNDKKSFHPWEPMPEEKLLELVSAKPQLPEKDDHLAALTELDAADLVEDTEDTDTKISFSGSDVARFIEVQDAHYLQNELQTYFQTELQWIISKSDCYKLKEHFNEHFDKVMALKVKEVGTIKEKNNRLRHIVSELNYFSEEKISVKIEDPVWRQVENPVLITQVKDDEVPITPYVSPSQQAILDAKAAEAERIRLLLLADDFRERALMKMMNGVLEVRWEDELKKEVPLPKCMIEKDPENFNEDDLRAVKDYEEKVHFLQSERTRYKTLLRAEYAKVAHSVRDYIKKFNAKLGDLLQLRLSVDSAISQESLKISRMKLFQHKRKRMIRAEHDILQKIVENDEMISSLFKLMNTLQEAVSDCRNYVDSFQVKDKMMDRAHKKDFQEWSIVIQEQAVKLFRKRPKINIRSFSSPTMLNDLAKCVMTNTKPSPTLNHECLEFLKQMEVLDMYVGVPVVVDEHTFAIVCKHRRTRIEYEIRFRAAQLELAEAEATSAAFHKRLQQKKEIGIKLNNDLTEVRQELIKVICNIDVQIVLPRGLVEIPLHGRLDDFDDAVLICRRDVEKINEIILDFGGRKIKALQQCTFFRRKILSLEWEHQRNRMLIEDLQEKLIDIGGVKLTKEIQFYLKSKEKEKAIPFETEVDLIKNSYEKTIQERKDKVAKLQKQISSIKKHDKLLERKISDLNVDICEFNMMKEHDLGEKERRFIDNRMKTHLRRSKLIKQIQDNHHEILMLQTELELLRLKTFPTLKYKVV